LWLDEDINKINCLQQRIAIQSCGMGILPVLVLLVIEILKMPVPQ